MPTPCRGWPYANLRIRPRRGNRTGQGWARTSLNPSVWCLLNGFSALPPFWVSWLLHLAPQPQGNEQQNDTTKRSTGVEWRQSTLRCASHWNYRSSAQPSLKRSVLFLSSSSSRQQKAFARVLEKDWSSPSPRSTRQPCLEKWFNHVSIIHYHPITKKEGSCIRRFTPK